MAYAFGGRIDDDSYAITYVDEDQGTAVTKGEINGVPFEGGGGGGDSLFYTANVKVNYTLPEGVESVEFYDYAQIDIYDSQYNNSWARIDYGDNKIPMTELGTPELIKLPLCTNGSVDLFSSISFPAGDNDYMYADSIEIVSGDAELVDNRTLIMGDCELNVTLVIGE